MDGPRPLPLVALPETRFTCHGCGECCRNWFIGPIGAEERARILARADELAPHAAAPPERWFVAATGEGLRAAAAAEAGGAYGLGRTAEGACVFLQADNLCGVHRYLGVEWKPFVCRRFPLEVTARPDATVLTIGVQCRTLARSRDDGQPLAEQGDWIRSVVSARRASGVASTVRLEGDVTIPYALARSIEQRALVLLGEAATLELAFAGIRDLVIGTRNALGRAPGLDDVEALRKARGRIDLARAMKAIRAVADALLKAVPRFHENCREGMPATAAPAAGDPFIEDVLRALRGDRPPAADAGAADPANLDFLRAAFTQLIGGWRALAPSPGLVYGFAHLALEHVLARLGARLLAERAGRRVSSREDWNAALSRADHFLGHVSLSAAAPAVIAIFEGIEAAA